MKRTYRVFAFLLFACAAFGQQAADVTSRIDPIATAIMTKQQVPAMTVAVASNGRIIYSKAFGTADLENSVAATTNTLIRTGSIAKPITAVAAMTLVEAGQLDLDAPVQTYCQAFPKKEWTITTRELLSHTSGIRHYKGDTEIESTKHYKKISDGFTIFANDPLLFEPGTKFSYSTYGYSVIGCVIEGASHKAFADYVAEHVLRPAGMTHTFVDDVYEIVPLRARGYTKSEGKVKNAGLMDSSYKIPGGGYVTTAEDLMHFAMALMDGKLLKPQTLALMWTPSNIPSVSDGKPSSYGMGFGALTVDGQKYIAHTGGQQGTATGMVIIPGKKFAAATLFNMDEANPSEVNRAILDLFGMPRPK